MKTMLCVCVALALSAGGVFGFSPHNIAALRHLDRTVVKAGAKIVATVTVTNCEADSVRGFFFTDHIPSSLNVTTISVRVGGATVDDYTAEFGSDGDVYTNCTPYRWILEQPTNFPESNPIPSCTGVVQITYAISSSVTGTFLLAEFEWAGYHQNIEAAAFGYSETADCQSVAFSSAQQVLVVNSLYGGAWPGSETSCYGSALSQWVTNSPVQSGGTQYVCVGASVESNSFTQVSPANVIVTLTNDAMLIWQWETQYWLTTATNGNGSVTVADGWYSTGTSTMLTATAGAGWHFTGWSGDTRDCVAAGNVITAAMTQPRTVVARFDETIAPLGTPEPWLLHHGLTNDLPAAEEINDTDGDGMLAWQEYVADTDPSNPMSVLSITCVTLDGNGLQVGWTGGEWARQYIQTCRNLTATDKLWTSIHTNDNLPTSITNSIIDSGATNGILVYRIKVER